MIASRATVSAGEYMRTMDRRQFLLMTGAAGAALVLAPETGEFSLEMSPPEGASGLETYSTTTCLMCPGGCGLRVRRVDGFPVGIAGNPNHPVNAGGVCSEGVASLQLLYHPDRVLRPSKRSDGRRANPFEPVSWKEALGEIAARLKTLRDKGTSEKLAFVLGRTGGSMEELVKCFMASWGSPNLFLDEAQDGYSQIFEVMHGMHGRPAFDFDNADLVLSFGADLFNAWQSPLQFQRSIASLRAASRGSHEKLIVADARFSRAASRADDWVGIAPSSYGALALGLAYVILREKLYDADFVEQRLYGFEDFRDESGNAHLGYRSLVLRDYSPEVVSRLTGAPVERVLALGKTFGESPAPLALFDENVAAQPGGLHAAMAVHSLNLLKGNINRRGGIYLPPQVPLKPLSRPPIAQSGGALVEDLAKLATKDLPEILFLYYSNPLYSSPLQRQLADTFARIPLIISFSPFLDETCGLVDFLLPDALFLERWEDRLFPSSSPAAGWGIVKPCVSAAGEARHSGDVILELARTLGSPLVEDLPWRDFEELLKHRARGLYEARQGTLCVDPFEQGLVAEMESRGWWHSSSGTFDEFWERLLEAGAWTDPNYQIRSPEEYSGHPDKKIDLYSRILQTRHSRNAEPTTDTECLPHYHSAEEQISMDMPMSLIPYRAGKLGGGTSAILPWILQGDGLMQSSSWNSWAEIHLADAQSLGIRNHDWIWVESPAGKLKVRAMIYPGAGRGVVNIPCGLGHSEMGRWARGRGINPLSLLSGERDPISGLPYRFGTKVKISKA